MPEPTGQPGDGGQGAGGAPAAGDPPKAPEPKPITFASQEELDRMIQQRLARAVPSDYEELKRKAGLHDEAANAAKSELEREQEARKAAEGLATQARAEANAILVRSAILVEASSQNAVDPEIVVALLAGSSDVAVKDGKVDGAKAAVKELLSKKPFLVKGAMPGASGGEFGGNDPKSKAQKIADLEAKANDPGLTAQQRQKFYSEARALKLANG